MTDEITKPKLKQSLIDHAADARLSRELVRLVCDANLPQPLDELAMKNIPKEPLAEFLIDQGFKTLLARLMGGTPTQTGATVRNDVMAAMDRKPAAAAEPEKYRGRPDQVRDGDRRSRPRPLDRRSDRAGLCRGRYRDRLHRLHHCQAGGG